MTDTNLQLLLDNNRRWSAARTAADPDFFRRLQAQQSPDYLWIGCSDSRVPANEIVGLDPGELFVHRNVANIVVQSDFNCLSVLQFAVDVLKIKHIIVCGHYGCGGVKAALEHERHGLVDNWLRHIRNLSERHRDALHAIEDRNARLNRLCEINVQAQVLNVSRTTVVEDAWNRGQSLQIHGWIYGLQDGLVRNLGLTLSRERRAETLI